MATPKPTPKKAPTRKPKPAPQKASFKGALARIRKDEKLLKRIFLGLAIALGVTYVLAVYAAFTTSIIPGKYIGTGFLLSFALTLALIYALTKRGPGRKFSKTVFTLATVGIIVNLAVFSVGMSTKSFIDSLSVSENGSYTQYAIVALKANHIKLDTDGQKVGVLEIDNTSDIKNAVARLTPATQTVVDNPADSINSLQSGATHMAVLTQAYLTDLQEGINNDLYQTLEILATFQVKSPETLTSTNLKEPFVIYISGIDTYGAIDKTSRSDVNILMAVNPKSHQILFVNTPRDYYVQLHGTTGVKDKLTHAGLYGIDMSQQTLEDLYGIDINYNVRINFTSLEKIVDTVGGIEVESEYNFSSGGYNFVIGKNQLDGKKALAFSRERYSFENGDRTRGQNQMRVLAALITKLSEPATLVKYQSIMNALRDVLQTNMTPDETQTLVRMQLDSLAAWTVTSKSVDGTGSSQPTYSMGAQQLYVMIPDDTSVESIKRKFSTMLQ